MITRKTLTSDEPAVAGGIEELCNLLRNGASVRRRCKCEENILGAYEIEKYDVEEMLRTLRFGGSGVLSNSGRITTPSAAGGSVRVRPTRP